MVDEQRWLRREPGTENKSATGCYVLLEAEGGERKLTILGGIQEVGHRKDPSARRGGSRC